MRISKGITYVLLAGLLWATTPSVGKLLLEDFDVMQIVFINAIFSTLLFATISYRRNLLSDLKTYEIKDYFFLGVLGLLGIFLYRILLLAAINLMPTQEAFIVNYTWPIMTVIFAWIILKEKLTPVKIMGLLISFLGVIIVVTKGNLNDLSFNAEGTIFALVAAASYGLFSVLSKKVSYDKVLAITIYSFYTIIFSGIAILLTSEIPTTNFKQLTGLAYLGFFPNGLAYLFWLLALKYEDTSKVSNIIFITPFLSLIFIYILLDEKILLSSYIGLVIIISGIFLEKAYSKAGSLIRPDN